MATTLTLLGVFVHIWAINAQQNPSVYQITDPVDFAQCPTWDSRNNLLYFVNIHEGQIFRYDYKRQSINSIKLSGEIGPVIPSKNDSNLLIVGLGRSVVALEWTGSNSSPTITLTTVSDQFPTSQLNDGKADSEGRLWIGSKENEGTNQGVLYKITCENLKSPEVEIANVSISSGLTWNSANDKLYYIDTPTGLIVEYSYDPNEGEISNPQVLFNMKDHFGEITGDPAGMTIDKDDNLWIALFGGGAVIKVSTSDGKLLQIVPMPALDVTSTMWGGPNLDILYVTTSRIGLTKQQKKQQSAAGAVFAVIGLGTTGLPMHDVDILQSIEDESCDV